MSLFTFSTSSAIGRVPPLSKIDKRTIIVIAATKRIPFKMQKDGIEIEQRYHNIIRTAVGDARPSSRQKRSRVRWNATSYGSHSNASSSRKQINETEDDFPILTKNDTLTRRNFSGAR